MEKIRFTHGATSSQEKGSGRNISLFPGAAYSKQSYHEQRVESKTELEHCFLASICPLGHELVSRMPWGAAACSCGQSASVVVRWVSLVNRAGTSDEMENHGSPYLHFSSANPLAPAITFLAQAGQHTSSTAIRLHTNTHQDHLQLGYHSPQLLNGMNGDSDDWSRALGHLWKDSQGWRQIRVGFKTSWLFFLHSGGICSKYGLSFSFPASFQQICL